MAKVAGHVVPDVAGKLLKDTSTTFAQVAGCCRGS